jgi:integrase
MEGSPAPAMQRRVRPHTLAWALERYRASSAWAGLSPATRRQREGIYKDVVEAAGEAPLADLDQDAIFEGRERRAAKPHSANNFLKAMRGFFGWACGDGRLLTENPTAGVKLLKGQNDDAGYHTWTEDEVRRFEAHWSVGTRQRLAMDLFLYTGLRLGDVARLGRQHVTNGTIVIRTEKTRKEQPIPILPPLAESIAATTTGQMTFLVTERGAPFAKESLGNWFRKAARAAGCPGSAHGLRKAGATRAAEQGATDRELMAFYGWSTAKMATHYTRAANQKHLATQAAQKLLPARMQNEKRPHRLSGAGKRARTSTKTGE